MTTDAFRDRTRGIPPAEVRRLSVLSPLRATLSLAQTWGIIALLLFVAHRFGDRPLVVALVVLGIAGQQHALAILTHQSAHYRMYKARWLNDAAGKLCGWPLAVSMLTYRIIHRIHHNHLYSAIDPDLALMAGYPRGAGYLARKLAKDLSGLTTIKNYLYFFGKPPKQPASPEAPDALDDTSDALRDLARRERRAVVVIHLLLLPVLAWTGAWRMYLLFWAFPAVTVLQALLRLRAVAEHGATAGNGDPMQSARTTLASPLVSWAVFPHAMHFHIEHHMYPSVPHYRLGECHRALVAAGALEGAEVVPSFTQTLRKIFAERDAPV